jgi:outer membrane protein assembly factor BamB
MLPPLHPDAAPRRRRRWPLAVGLLLLLALVAGGLTAFFLTRGDDESVEGVQAHNALGGLVDLPHGLRTEPRASWSFHGGTVQWAAASDGDVFVAVLDEDRSELLRLAGGDGSVRWRADAPVGEVSTMHVADGVLLVSLIQQDSGTASLEAFDAETGAPAWRYERPAADILGSLADDGYTVALVQTADAAAELVVLDRTGDVVWTRPVDDVAADGKDVLVQAGGDVTMVDLATGEDRWSVPAGEGASIGLVGGRSVVADRRAVEAYDRSGTRVWRQDLPADDPGGVYGQGDGLAVIVRNSSVVALAVADGARRWEAPFSGIVTDTAPTALTLRSTDDDLTMRVIDGATGASRATRILAPPEGVAVADDVVYVGDGRSVTAYDRESLAPLWSSVVADEGGGRVVEAVDGGVLVRDGEGNLTVLH